MSPRVAYWTSSFEFDTEAVAGEVALLRRAFPKSVAWGISARDGLRCSWARGFAVSSRFEMPFRMLTNVAQRAFQVNHLFGGLGDWSHLRAVGKTPAVMTVAVQSDSCDKGLLDKIARFVVEWPSASEHLRGLGVDDGRIELIYPPVDLARFAPTPRQADPFTVLFLSSPDRADWMAARGVDLLLDTAALRPHMRFLFVWRPWGNSEVALRQAIKDRGLTNVEICVGKFANVARYYAEAHVTAAPFCDLSKCKPAPNSIVESLACGRPAVVTRKVGLAPLIDEHQAGCIVEEDAQHLAEQLDRLESQWDSYSTNARVLAESQFSAPRFVEAYRDVYAGLL